MILTKEHVQENVHLMFNGSELYYEEGKKKMFSLNFIVGKDKGSTNGSNKPFYFFVTG